MSSLKRSSPWLFFGLAYGLSWLLWIPAALLGKAEPATLVLLLHYLGGLMPPLVAIVLTYVTQDREGRRDYWRRIVDFRRIPLKWYGVILLTVPAITALAALVDRLWGGHGLRLELAARFLERPLMILPLGLFYLIFGPLPEEIGWRGYALDRLQTKWNALVSSLILGVAWTMWHLPLFFITGSYQHSLLGSLSFWLFLIDKPAQSILMTWIYNHTRRSTLSAVLFHFMVNFVGELFELTERAELCYVLLWIGAAVAIVIIYGSKTLTRARG